MIFIWHLSVVMLLHYMSATATVVFILVTLLLIYCFHIAAIVAAFHRDPAVKSRGFTDCISSSIHLIDD